MHKLWTMVNWDFTFLRIVYIISYCMFKGSDCAWSDTNSRPSSLLSALGKGILVRNCFSNTLLHRLLWLPDSRREKMFVGSVLVGLSLWFDIEDYSLSLDKPKERGLVHAVWQWIESFLIIREQTVFFKVETEKFYTMATKTEWAVSPLSKEKATTRDPTGPRNSGLMEWMNHPFIHVSLWFLSLFFFVFSIRGGLFLL